MEPKTEQQYRDEYRAQLLEYAKQSQTSYDSTLITLSGGALGISFAFVNQFIGNDPIRGMPLLVAAWVCWVISLGAVLLSFYSSSRALQKVVNAMDRGEALAEMPGGRLDQLTGWLNAVSGVLLVVGVVVIIWFALLNL
jgi:hypothetical protein